ncbi:MAG TPA: helix-turn-helix domain-containing protein [Thermoplasmata archaeon]|nr:helix-turn-helix domain-containing protein [Thermoplasmata archaeon]
MPLRRVTVDLPSRPLFDAGFVPKGFFAHNESVEILHVYAFQPRERVLLVRIVRSGRPLSESEIVRRRESFRRRYRLRDFEILRVGEDGRTFVALLRQANPGILEQILEELGAGVTPITPTVLRKDVSTLSFVADDATEKEIFTLLDGLGVRWRLRGRQAVRLGQESGTDLTPRQRELLSLAWNLGYFDIPARADLRKIADLTGLSRNTVSQHLRRGMRRILREWIA